MDVATGEVRDVELLVMVLGASNYTYTEATFTQSLPDFVGSTIRWIGILRCGSGILVPDQLRSAVRGPDRHEPDINATYLEMAQHYGVAVMPARPGRPRDKAKVEVAVLIAQRWILARLRHRTFFSLAELNAAIAITRTPRPCAELPVTVVLRTAPSPWSSSKRTSEHLAAPRDARASETLPTESTGEGSPQTGARALRA